MKKPTDNDGSFGEGVDSQSAIDKIDRESVGPVIGMSGIGLAVLGSITGYALFMYTLITTGDIWAIPLVLIVNGLLLLALGLAIDPRAGK